MLDSEWWIGWDNLLDLYERRPTEDHGNVFVTAFETGGRESELLSLKPTIFEYADDGLRVQNMVVLKYKGRRMTRNFLIPNDKLTPIFKEFLEKCETTYLFPKKTPYGAKIIKDLHASRWYIYTKITELSPNIWPHWIRGQRAMQLVADWKYGVVELCEWFKWKNTDTPVNYIHKGLEIQAKDFGMKNTTWKKF